MIIKDRLLGNIRIDNDIVEEIINTPTMQRLKNISLGSYYPAFPDVAHKASRFEHSIGVYFLLNKFNAPLEEQIAGLIHDVSHSAFSHTIDYIIKKDKDTSYLQGYQDSIHNKFVLKSEIYKILNKYNFDIDSILNGSFVLLDCNYPNLCADRIDNGLRGALNIKNYPVENINIIVENLTVLNNTFVFTDVNAAMLFYKLFEYGNEHYWSNFKSAVMFSLNKQLFRHAIEMNYINIEDFYKYNDKEIIEIILLHKSDKVINRQLMYLNQKDYKQFMKKNNYSFIDKIKCKFRRVDPFVLINNKIENLSQIIPQIKYDFTHNTPQYLSHNVYFD